MRSICLNQICRVTLRGFKQSRGDCVLTFSFGRPAPSEQSYVVCCRWFRKRLENTASVLGSYCFGFCCLSRPRNFILALCNCDFEVPTEHPNILAISSCSCPSIS